MNGFGKALMGVIHVLMDRLMARWLSSGITTLALVGIVLLLAAGGASAEFACVADDGSDDAYFFGDTVMKSCTFNGSMSGTNSHGLCICADDVVIDGAGYMITGDNTPYTVGIYNYDSGFGICGGGHNNVAIRNLEISGFTDGIRVQGTMNDQCTVCRQKVENNNIYNCTVHDNSEGFGINFWKCVCNSTIDRCTVYNITGTLQGSCDDPGAGIRLWGKSNHNNVIDNIAYHNDLAGIYSKKGGGDCYNTISSNTVYENGQTGTNAHFTGGIRFQCKSTDDNRIEDNIVTDNFGPGIFIGGNDCTVKNNIVTESKDAKNSPNSRGDGLRIDRGSDGGGRRTQVYNNTFCDNGHIDISADDSTQNTTGDCNTCNTTSNYNDDGTTGCTFTCGASEGACVGATQCFTCGDTVTESCTLNGDMSCTSDYGLIVGADDIVIDGNGFAIDGVTPGACPELFDYYCLGIGFARTGIVASRKSNVTIKNVEVRNFCSGILIYSTSSSYSSEDNTIENCIVHDNGNLNSGTATGGGNCHGISLCRYVHNSTIHNNTIYNTSGKLDGDCDDNGAGILIKQYSNYNNVTNNKVFNNTLAGIYSKKGGGDCYNYIAYNTVHNNGKIDPNACFTGGIRFQCKSTDDTTFENNIVTDNFGSGIFIGGNDCTVRNNIVTGSKNASVSNPGYGLWNDREGCGGGQRTQVYNNTFCNNVHLDINVQSTAQGVTGDCNTCNTTSNYDDDGTTGCTFTCGASEGACVGVTQCFTCGDTVTESCTLNGDMSCPANTNGLIIGANDIVIDGNGKKISGSPYTGLGLTYGISANDKDNIIIKDMELEGFDTGIRIKGDWWAPNCMATSDNPTIDNCTIHGCGNPNGAAASHGIDFMCAPNGRITNCTIYNNTGIKGDTCDDGGNGILLFGGSSNTFIANNEIYGNALAGIYSKMQCTHNNITCNTVYENGVASDVSGFTGGIRFQCKKSDFETIEDNIVTDNIGPGIFIGGNDCIVRNNTVTGSKNAKNSPNSRGDGLRNDRHSDSGGKRTVVIGNTFCDNEHLDINVENTAQGVTGDDNTCNSCYNYNDTGTTCCTHKCGVCVGATQDFECGDTVTESCTLNWDMSCQVGNGLEIGANGITIDGNGYAINGVVPSECLYYLDPPGLWIYNKTGIYNYLHDSVTIKNLEVKNFCMGIWIKGADSDHADNITIDNCTVHDNGNPGAEDYNSDRTQGIFFKDYVWNSRITNCEVYNNTGMDDGSCCSGGMGIRLTRACNHNVITSNDIHDNIHSGIYSKMQCEYNNVTYNHIYENGHIGATAPTGGITLRCKLSDNWVFANNIIEDNYGSGIFIGGHYNAIKNNIITGNKNRSGGDIPEGHGICLGRTDDGSYYNSFFNNTVCDNEGTDIYVCGGCPGNHGDCNTCNTTSNYDDDGTTGCTYDCPGEADLTITAKYEQWFGDVYNVIYTIKNIGHSTASESTTGIYIDGNLAKTDAVGLIGPGVSYIRTVGPFTMSDDDDTILVCADNASVVDETNEDNNCLENVFTSVVMPDLVIISKSEEWSGMEDKTYNISYTVKNIGNTAADASDAGIYIDGAFNRTVPTKALAPNEEETKTIGPFTMSDGSDTIKVCADNNSIVPENDEENNCLENVAEVDLVVVSKTEDWVSMEDETYNISYTVKNTGTIATDASDAGIYIDGIFNRTVPTKALAPNEEEGKTIGPFTMSDGSDTIKVCADNNSIVPENDEENNCLENVAEVDLVVVSKSESWVSKENKTYNISYTIKNAGTIAADASDAGIHIDGAFNRTVPTKALAPNEEETKTIGPFTMTDGNDTIKVCADNNSVISEVDENNNCLENLLEFPTVGCVAGDGILFICGELVTKSCTLNGDMNCPATGNGLVVGADNIVIDGAGYTLNGSVASATCNAETHSGVVNVLSDNVVVKNLEIQNFCCGIEIGEYYTVATDVVVNMAVTGCKIHDCGRLDAYTNGIYMWGPTYCDITKNEIYNISGRNEGACTDGGNGIFLRGCSFGEHDNGDHNTLTCNRIYDVTKTGIFMRYGCMHNTMSYNHITGCPETGINPMCMRSDYNTYEYNNLSDNIGGGFSTGGSYNVIRFNTAHNNGGGGISEGNIENTVTNNSACGNSGIDIGGDICCNNTCGSGCGCDWNCNNPTPVYFDFDSDGHYSTTPESCTCSNILSIGSCCNPGLFNASHAAMLNASGICWLVPGDDPNDCDPSIPEPKPDLVITEKSEAWISLEDKTYNITYTVKNIGNANANESTTSIRIDGTEVTTDPVPALAPDATHNAELGPFTMSDGSDTIRVCADNESVVIESNEDNNCKENTFKFHGKPDLVISKKYEEWVASNETYTIYNITYTIRNIGTGNANESTTSIRIDGIEAATDPVEALGEGESYINTIGPFTMTGENDMIRICADNESAIEEGNEANNCIENTFNYSETGCVAVDGTLFRCGNTVTKSCTLNGDMLCTIGAGLTIGADGITIDGNDHRMTGTVTPDDCNGMGSEASPCTISGIYNAGVDNVVVKNLEIENFCTGIALTGVCNITVNNCSIHDNGFNTGNMATHGIHACNIAEGAPDDPALTITENEIYNNEGTGAACGDGGNGIFIFAGSGDKHEYCNISHNRLHNNAKAGFWTKMMLTRSEIVHNEIWGNGYGTGITDDQRGGIVLRCKMSNENLIAYNDVHDNDVDGIFIGGSSNSIEYNSVTNNTDDGIDMGRSDGSYNNELYENTVCDNWDKDISTFGADSNTVGDGNTCDTTKDYDDTGATGCTYPCGGSAGGTIEFSSDRIGYPSQKLFNSGREYVYWLYNDNSKLHPIKLCPCG